MGRRHEEGGAWLGGLVIHSIFSLGLGAVLAIVVLMRKLEWLRAADCLSWDFLHLCLFHREREMASPRWSILIVKEFTLLLPQNRLILGLLCPVSPLR